MPINDLINRLTGARRKSKFISARVPSNSTEIEEFELPRDVKITNIEARFYPGQQLDLELKPRLRKKDSDTRIDLVDYPGDKNHLEGDDDHIKLPTNVEGEKEDVVEVKAVNQDQNGNAYDYHVIITLEDDL
jgi:hypothetical protein